MTARVMSIRGGAISQSHFICVASKGCLKNPQHLNNKTSERTTQEGFLCLGRMGRCGGGSTYADHNRIAVVHSAYRMKNIVQNYESRKSPEVCEFWVEEQDHKEASFFRLSEGRCRLNAVGFKLGKHMCGANGKKNRQYTKSKFLLFFLNHQNIIR